MQNDEQLFASGPPPDAARMVQAAVRAERERMAKLLHATTCQELTGGYLMVCATALQCRKLAPELEHKLNTIAERLQAAGEGLRQVLHSLESEEQGKEKDS